MNLSKLQMELAREGRDLAAKALSQSIERQQYGTILPFELMQTQEIYIKSRLDYLRTVSAYNKAQYRLFIAMGNNL